MDRVEIFQNKTTISIPREGFLKNIVFNDHLKKNDLRVFCLLVTTLGGWNYDARHNSRQPDPYNFDVVDIEKVADSLGMKKKDVKKSMKRLEDELILEKGDSSSINDGYRFMF